MNKIPCLLSLLAMATGSVAEELPALLRGLAVGDFSAPMREADRQALPTREIDGEPPESGVRYWQTPLYKMDSFGCYVSWINCGTDEAPQMEKWENEWGRNASERGMVCETGTSFAAIAHRERRFSGEIINDVFTPPSMGAEADAPPTLSPLRGITRTETYRDSEYGRIALVCACPDYRPGSVSLMPAILTSPDGAAGSWTYHGLLTGEPQEELARLNGGNVWSDGGSLFRMPDASWRIYLNGFGGATLAMLTADTLKGPWKFLRDENGAIRDLFGDGTGVPVPKVGLCFPHVLRVSDTEWHFWASDQWTPQSIWHYVSEDGLAWKAYGQQPEITRALVGGRGIKCLRTYLSEDKKTIYGFLSVWSDVGGGSRGSSVKGWRLYVMTLPAGLL
ncbi:MAG: hypothetical protein FWF84_01165 [Kiritimatiellaeota bacterium]|nr:hypothetical protein [Kiritimatiellota bacterium]